MCVIYIYMSFNLFFTSVSISGGVCSRFVETRGRPSALLVDLAYPFLILEEYLSYASRHARPKRSDVRFKEEQKCYFK